MGPALTARRLLPRLFLIVIVAALTTAVVRFSWSAIGGGSLGVHGVIALSLGVLGTVILTWTLMSLAFKSSREGWDERSADPDKP